MTTFVQTIALGALGSLVATAIWVALIYLFSKRLRKALQIAANRAFETGVRYIYQNQEDALQDIIGCYKESARVKILTLRGDSFLNDGGALRCLMRPEAGKQLFFLMSDPSSGNNSYVVRRAVELETINQGPASTFLNAVRLNVQRLAALSGCQERKLHNSPPAFRLIIFDKDLFLLFYSTKGRARDGRVYRCPVESELYSAFDRYFDLVSAESKVVDAAMVANEPVAQ